MRNLTIGEQRLLARALRSSCDLVYSFDLAPVDVNILPMNIVVDTETVDCCVEALHQFFKFDPVLSREIVLSVLKAATDIGRGSTEHSESQTGGPAPGAPSGADHD